MAGIGIRDMACCVRCGFDVESCEGGGEWEEAEKEEEEEEERASRMN